MRLELQGVELVRKVLSYLVLKLEELKGVSNATIHVGLLHLGLQRAGRHSRYHLRNYLGRLARRHLSEVLRIDTQDRLIRQRHLAPIH